MKKNISPVRGTKLVGILIAFNLYSLISISYAQTTDSTKTKAVDQQQVSASANTAPDADKQIRAMLKLEKMQAITYKDDSGKDLTAEDFLARMNAGASFGMMKRNDNGQPRTATLTLDKPNLKPEPIKDEFNIKIGQKLPDFNLQKVGGGSVSNKSLIGKFTVINFYFSDCSPCVEEIPELNAIASKHKNMNFIAITHDDNVEAQQFITANHFAWAVVPDSKKFIDKIGIKFYPSFIILDPSGKVVEIANLINLKKIDNGVNDWINRLVGKASNIK